MQVSGKKSCRQIFLGPANSRLRQTEPDCALVFLGDCQTGEAIMDCIRRRPFRKKNAAPLFEPPFFCALPLMLLVWVAAISGAQAQTSGGAIYGVTSVDVVPSATSQGIALLKQYRDAALKQPGNQGVTLLQEVGWPNLFAIYEAWTDQSAYDANEKAAHTAEFCDKLQSISSGRCDRRDYFVISVGPAREASAAHPIYMILHLDVLPKYIQTIFAPGKQLAEAARQGEGNLRFDVLSGAHIPTNYMTIFAAWQNRKAFDDYEMSAYARQFRDTVGKVLGSPYDDRLYTPIN
jgi:quinol monooxygenase YgiN